MFNFLLQIESKLDADGFYKAEVKHSDHEELIGMNSFARTEKKAVAFLLDQIAQWLKK